MRNIVCLGIALVLVACSGSKSTVPADAAGTLGDAAGGGATGPDTGKSDTASSVAGAQDGGRDVAMSDGLSSPDAGRSEASVADAEGAGHDLASPPDASKNDAPSDHAPADIPADLSGNEAFGAVDSSKSDVPGDRAAIIDDAGYADTGERCSCENAVSASPARVSWGCFCSVEDCQRTLAYFVEYADGGRTLKIGTHAVLLQEYADCNLVLVQAKTYSDYVPSSEYVFDRGTGALVGAKVWLDDSQHTCPFAASDARWVFGYESGTYPVPASCHASGGLGG